MTVNNLSDTQGCVDFFQQRLHYLLTYWRDHEAVQQLQIAILDRERAMIPKVISLGLDVAPLWPLVRPLIIALTPYMERRGHWEEWHTILERAIAVTQRAKDIETETTLTALLARLCQRMSRPKDVVKNYRRVIRLAKMTGNRFEEARACSNLGYLYIDGGHWWRSENLSKHALTIFEELGSDHGRAHTHNHLGLLYTRQQLWNAAEEHLLSACKVWTRMDEQHGLMRGYGNLGTLYCDMTKADDAIYYSKLALQLAQTTGEEILSGNFLINMAIGYRLQGDAQSALQHATTAEKIFEAHHDMVLLAYVWHQLGLIYLQDSNLAKAEQYRIKALTIYEQFNNIIGKTRLLADFNTYATS
ncbi:tetratricopeptide repeat protein [Chloroflexi bacterium TSY]|nr:tetratricopeptide repeat protein [Chloroflexi bacterium TSY]